jgi:hypothetical protein
MTKNIRLLIWCSFNLDANTQTHTQTIFFIWPSLQSREKHINFIFFSLIINILFLWDNELYHHENYYRSESNNSRIEKIAVTYYEWLLLTHTPNRIYSLNLFVPVVLNDLILFSFVLSFILWKVSVWIVFRMSSVQ